MIFSSSLLASLLWLGAANADFYVSPNGKDSNKGGKNDPFATLGAAQKAVRGVNSGMTTDLNVYVAPGTYYLSSPLTLTNDDSGSNGHRIIWQAGPSSGSVNISGGSLVSGWTTYDSSKGIYQASVPSGSKSRHLFVNQKHAQRARVSISRSGLKLLNNGFQITNDKDQYITSLKGIETGELRTLNSFTNRYIPISSVIDMNHTLIMASPAFNNNIIGYDTVTDPDRDNGCYIENVLTLLNAENEYFLDESNATVYYKPYNGLDINKQYIVLPRLEQLLILAGTYDNPIHDITFQGFNFMHTTWNQPSSDLGYVDQQTGTYIGINKTYSNFESSRPFWYQVPGSVQVSAATDISIQGGSLSALMGGIGIGNDPNAHASPGVGLGASNIDVTGVLFVQTGANAITVGGISADAHHPSKAAMTNENITVQENIFYDQQYTISSGTPIFVTYVTGAKVLHNDISNIPYSGICYGYGWGSNDAGGSSTYKKRGLYNYQPIYNTPTTEKDGLIAYNLIQKYGTVHDDLGAIYTLSASSNTSITQNWVVDATQKWPALYHDEGSRYFDDSYSVFQTGFWLNKKGGNKTIHDIYVYKTDTLEGNGSNGDRVYNITSFSSYKDLPQKFQDVVSQAGLSPSNRAGKPLPTRPAQP